MRNEAQLRASKRRILIWAAIAAVITGLLGLGQPIDDLARALRNVLRLHPPSGDIVLVGIDDKAVQEVGSWPWPRTRHAQIIDRLKAAGAEHIYFDIIFHAKSTPREDARLAESIKRAGNVSLAVTYTRDIATLEHHARMPIPVLREHADLFSVMVKYTGLASIRESALKTRYEDMELPTLPAMLTGVQGSTDLRFPIDYAIDIRRVSMTSAADVIDGTFAPGTFAGKKVLIGLASRELGDVYFVPGRGMVNGVYVNVVAAETLRRGMPRDLGWLVPFLVALMLSVIHLFARPWMARSAIALGLFGLTVLPLVAEEAHIFYDIVPALLLVGAVAGSAAWANFRQSYKVRGNINAISGLPNLNALREAKATDDAVLVGARVRNFAEIVSSLPPEGERALVDQIVARLALGARGARIYQGDEGIFMWATNAEVAGPDQLDALHALFRSPGLVDGRPIDLSVTFGTDTVGGRTLANRIGATLVAADEAATEGLRWKAYDPAKLADAEWKLSLLGRLDAAIDSGEVWVAYQPQLDLATGRICGAEALVRWSHPEKGAVSPMEFVLAAEQHNRIDKLTEFVLGDAVRLAAAFNDRGLDFEVAVNISARLLEKPGLVTLVRQQLIDSGLEPGKLTLEVTESAAMASGRQSIRTLEEIGSLGINVSIDDYGTGFSTLEYFKKIPATEVKIDRGFVAAIDRSASDRLMVRSTIELAHSLGRSVVAEGVETDEILAELRKLGCDRAQGYLIGKPMKAVSLGKLILDKGRKQAA